MEYRTKCFFLIPLLLTCHQNLFADDSPTEIVNPGLERREPPSPTFSTKDIELGLFYGALNIDDFSTNQVYGIRGAYHLNESIFFEANYGFSQGGLTSYEKLSGSSSLLSDDDRDYQYYNIAAGFTLLPSEVFFGNDHSFHSSLYAVTGVGNTQFGGSNSLTFMLGIGYRLHLTDTIAWHFDLRDNIFDRDLFGDKETTHNVEFTTAISIFF